MRALVSDPNGYGAYWEVLAAHFRDPSYRAKVDEYLSLRREQRRAKLLASAVPDGGKPWSACHRAAVRRKQYYDADARSYGRKAAEVKKHLMPMPVFKIRPMSGADRLARQFCRDCGNYTGLGFNWLRKSEAAQAA